MLINNQLIDNIAYYFIGVCSDCEIRYKFFDVYFLEWTCNLVHQLCKVVWI